LSFARSKSIAANEYFKKKKVSKFAHLFPNGIESENH